MTPTVEKVKIKRSDIEKMRFTAASKVCKVLKVVYYPVRLLFSYLDFLQGENIVIRIFLMEQTRIHRLTIEYPIRV